jgi:hypothetical protein
MMVKNLADGNFFEIWNGYREFPSPELNPGFLVIAKGRLVAKYPDLFTVTALPFYMLFKYRGVFFLNAVAFLGILALTYQVARICFGDSKLATSACLILAFSTYLWDYSQAAWPHAISTLFIIAAFYAMARAFFSESHTGRSVWWAFFAGILGGAAPGMRLDAAFAIPILLIPLLFISPPRWKALLAAGTGLVPGFVALSLLNHHKFDRFTPFSYGLGETAPITTTSSLLPYLTLVIGGFSFVLVVWILSRSSIRGKQVLAAVIIIGAGVGLINVPVVYKMLERLATGGAQLLIDLRFRSLFMGEGGLADTPMSSISYIGGLKKSLLQSCPYLVVLAIPLLQVLRRGRDAKAIMLLLFLPACYIGVYSYFSWHGGQCLNLRYFVPTLPFMAILAAYAWRRLTYTINRRWLLLGLVAIAAAGLVHAIGFDRENAKAEINEFLILSLPLYMAGILTILLAMVMLEKRWQFATRRISGIRTSATIICLTAMIWAGSMAFFYDYPLQRAEREKNHNVAAKIGGIISDDSIIFGTYPDPLFGLIEYPKIRIAIPMRDQFKDFRQLVAWHLDQGRPVYTAFRISKRRLGDDVIQKDISGEGIVYQIIRSDP